MNHRKSGARRAAMLSVPIVRQYGDKYVVDKPVLQDVLCDDSIADMKVVIISMCGPVHCGKSLTLNYFYDYLLRTRNATTPRDSNPPKKCFAWGNGIKTQKKTIGIHITRKPVIFSRQGEQIAVFLLDSEGINIRSGPLHQSLFNLVTLLSSVQIVNVEKDIQDRDIFPLKGFLHAYDALKDCVENEVFENNVTFLVRDCANTLTCKLGYDQSKQFLTKSFQSGYKRMAFENLNRAFAGVDCFVLPHPGSKAIVKQVKNEFRGTFDELNESFVLYLRDFMDHVLARDKLVIKRVNGKALTCSEFAEYIEQCESALSNRDPQTALIKLFAHTRYQPLVTKCFDSFKDSLQRAIKKNALDEDEFGALWENRKAVAMQEFENGSFDIPLNDQIKHRYRLSLQQQLDEYEDDARSYNETFFNECKSGNEKVVNKSRKTYEGEFQAAVASAQTDGRTIQECHEIAKINSLRVFDRAVKQGGNCFIDKYKNELLHDIQNILDEKLEEIAYIEPETNDADVTASAIIGWNGGSVTHDACSLKFPRGSATSDTQISIAMADEDDAWPAEDYVRKAPFITITGGDRPIRKPANCTVPCWHISFSPDVTPDENLYVMQKKGGAWVKIHDETIGRKMKLSFALTELSPITLALSVKKQLKVSTLLNLDAEGNFRAFFFDMIHIGAVKDSAKAGRCMTKSDINTIRLNPRDVIQVSLSRVSGSDLRTREFLAEEINGMKSIAFCGPDVNSDEIRTTMKYEIKVNGETKVLDEFNANLNNPGRPDTARHGPVLINRTHAVGDYLTLSTTLE